MYAIRSYYDARLDREQVLGETAVLDLVLEELHDVAGDRLGGVVHLGEGATLVAVLRLDNGDDLVGVAGDVV